MASGDSVAADVDVVGRRGTSGIADATFALVRRAGPLLTGSVVPFALILYLAFKQGGYDIVPRGEAGIAVWWTILIAAAAGVLPSARMTRPAWIALGLLAAFVLWTLLGISWSTSSERSVASLGLVSTYLGFLVLGVITQGREAGRRVVNAVATAIAVVVVLALLSRFQPDWLGGGPLTAASRLAYPIGYWNGLAALSAMGLPLLLLAAARARTLLARGLAAAAVPAMGLASFYTFSRGGAIEAGVALVVLLALYRRRLALLPTLAVDGLATTILISAALQRDALQNGVLDSLARSQANEMLAMTLVVCAGAGLLQLAIALAERHTLGPRLRVTRAQSIAAAAVTAIVVIAVVIAAGVPGRVSTAWRDFKNPDVGPHPTAVQRFDTASGHGRYQLWSSANHENTNHPLTGSGPGTYQYWWNQHGDLPIFVQNAHSLYLETFGELGVVGLLTIAAFILWVLVRGGWQALRGWRGYRSRFAAITASGAAFATAAGFDWVWQIAVIPAAFLLLAAVVMGADAVDPGQHRRPRARAGGLRLRLGLCGAAIAATIAIGIPLAAATSLRASQADVRAHDLSRALSAARSAHSIEPYAASPLIQEAEVLELQHKLGEAAVAARQATAAEATNWRTWLTVSRIESERGHVDAALRAYRKARRLDPRSLLFQRFSVSAGLPEATLP